MKVDKKNIALAGTTGGTIALGTLYGVSQNKQEEQRDEAVCEPEVKEIIKEIEVVKENPKTLSEVERLKRFNTELDGTIDSLTEEVDRVNGELGKAEQKVKDLQEELEYERNWTNQLEGWRENDIVEKKNLKVALEDALRRLDEKDQTIEAVEAEKVDLQSNVSELFNDNSTLREQNFYVTEAYNSLSESFSAYRDAMIKALAEERNRIRIKEDIGCWYSNSQSDNKGTWGLNCENITFVGSDGNEYKASNITVWAKDSKDALWKLFEGRHRIYGDGKIETIK